MEIIGEIIQWFVSIPPQYIPFAVVVGCWGVREYIGYKWKRKREQKRHERRHEEIEYFREQRDTMLEKVEELVDDYNSSIRSLEDHLREISMHMKTLNLSDVDLDEE